MKPRQQDATFVNVVSPIIVLYHATIEHLCGPAAHLSSSEESVHQLHQPRKGNTHSYSLARVAGPVLVALVVTASVRPV